MFFPKYRPRRMRQNKIFRRIVQENLVSLDDMILPLFVVNGKNIKDEIETMPGQYRLSIDKVIEVAKEAFDLGIPGIMLFGIPSRKDSHGTRAYDRDGIVQRGVEELKNKIPNMLIITDVCLCQYTDHGHCGIINRNEIDNDITLEFIAKIALSHAQAGADMVAPSDMMDGRIFKIRTILDENGFTHIPIMSYAVKYCSNYYGPFRDAAHSAPNFGDRLSYQMNPSNSREAIREAMMDVNEGADIVMVKPSLAYLDIIAKIKESINLPIAAYNVSGEYSMIKAADKMDWIDGQKVMMETLMSIKRAGADIILTYFALEVARIINI